MHDDDRPHDDHPHDDEPEHTDDAGTPNPDGTGAPAPHDPPASDAGHPGADERERNVLADPDSWFAEAEALAFDGPTPVDLDAFETLDLDVVVPEPPSLDALERLDVAVPAIDALEPIDLDGFEVHGLELPECPSLDVPEPMNDTAAPEPPDRPSAANGPSGSPPAGSAKRRRRRR